MKVLSLFSGIGGFDLGFQRAGMQVVGMCEIDKNAQKILQRHFPDATLHTDVRKVCYERGTIDVVCGGFPCQDLSVAGKRRGLDGERSGLWFEFARIIDETEPSWVVIENVPGLFSSAGGADFAVIIQWLANRGYGVGWRVLDAQGFGLAQRRKRVFIVASFGNPSGCTLLFEQKSMCWDNQSSRTKRKNNTTNTQTSTDENIGESKLVPFAIQGNIIDRKTGGANGLGISQENVSYTLTAMDRHAVAVQQNTCEEVRFIQGDGNVVGAISAQSGMHQQNYVAFQNISPTLRAESKQSLMSGDGNINAPLAMTNILWEMHHTDNPTRLCPNPEISPTLMSRMGTGGNNVPLIGVRRLTPIECERLQGFPDNWTDEQSDSQRYKQLGNAVAVPVAEWIAKRIFACESGE